ncbi:MAG: hypothetical protein KDK62_04285 [Chlamydiia bacterium]|nr:hypothetical protein [Chlamydiia bacterium]
MKRFLLFSLISFHLFADNQTTDLSPILPQDDLPYTIEFETASFSLPTGIQGHAVANYKGKWVFVAGRTNGLHGFANSGNNFPPSEQNKTIYVTDPATGVTLSRSLEDASSELSQEEIDDLSVVAPEFYQKGSTLYFVGGYGFNNGTGNMETKPRLTAIDLKKLISWVETGAPSVKSAIKQVTDEFFRVTGGALFQSDPHHPFLLMLGQNFPGLYTPGSNGIYTQQIRAFWVVDDGNEIKVTKKEDPVTLDDWRRRDLNVVPILNDNRPSYVALSGVFTLSFGIWTVPLFINPDGSSFQPDPNNPNTFKQGMNNYITANFGMYSVKNKLMHVILAGGISFGYFDGGTFTTDSNIPFINQATAITIDKKQNFTQYLLDNEYPVIPSTGPNAGNPLLFGAEAVFFPAKDIPLFYNGVIQMDKLPKTPTVLGYIASGIMSTVPNTSSTADSTASPYVFVVKWVPKT